MEIDCNLIKIYLQLLDKSQIINAIRSHPTLEVHGDEILKSKLTQDVRTYICYQGKCKLHYKRSHRRISTYNWKKLEKMNSNLVNIAIKFAEQIITESKEKSNIEPIKRSKKICDICHYPKIRGIKHQHFIKESTDNKDMDTQRSQTPIEEIFSRIDDIALNNKSKILKNKNPNPPGKQIKQLNNIRMSYGDINYLGNNKALLYFDRGVRGIQTFNNSMQPISRQPKNKDIIILDGIVFISSCMCLSSTQHNEMFPHYRVTCAAGLTCPARLNNFEKEIFKRSRNASTEMFTKASAMLIRYWK